ncbi:acyl-CoA dehydrogenase family protein [Actinomadura luteofluorescens]|uniref:acyl-CoA dehydrogenase family protein n=1 Tax=Actinomadura luteofluorescens TaxID=46163 RepID=UPI00362603D5
MLAHAEQARACAWDAARAHDEGAAREASLAAAVAGATSVQAAFQTAKDCVQTLGGIGFTWEHDASLYLRRAQTLRVLLGSTASWRRRVARLTLDGVRRELRVELPRRPSASASRSAPSWSPRRPWTARSASATSPTAATPRRTCPNRGARAPTPCPSSSSPRRCAPPACAPTT